MNKRELAAQLVKSGLIEFGYFQNPKPGAYRLRFDLLPAYPQLLGQVATALIALFDTATIDRWVCDSDSVPLGTAISLQTGIPLVYSAGKGEAPLYDLVGAYDVGHPAALILNVVTDAGLVHRLIAQGAQVGLEIKTGVALMGINATPEITPLLPFETFIRHLMDAGMLPAGQATAIYAQNANHHPG
ncbi:MAG: hypothetical protein H7Y11_01495 [Armatimonadetes bacterium]|nr:hypothetical protein [Anaerolineae bacterium]